MMKRTKLLRAIWRRDRETVQALLARGAPVEPSFWRGLFRSNASSPLEAAVIADVPSVVSDLLDHGADPNGSDRPGAPLAYACGRGSFPIIQLLVDRGALVDPPPHPRRLSPLNSAVTQRRVEVMEWLLAHGANPNDVFAGKVVLDRIPGPLLLRLIEAGGKAPPEIERAVRAGEW